MPYHYDFAEWKAEQACPHIRGFDENMIYFANGATWNCQMRSGTQPDEDTLQWTKNMYAYYSVLRQRLGEQVSQMRAAIVDQYTLFARYRTVPPPNEYDLDQLRQVKSNYDLASNKETEFKERGREMDPRWQTYHEREEAHAKATRAAKDIATQAREISV